MTTTVFFSPGGLDKAGLRLVLRRHGVPFADGHGDLELMFPQLFGLHAVTLLLGHLLEVLHGDFIVHQRFHGAGAV